MRFRPLVLVFVLTALAWSADYQVVMKSTGKIVHGQLISEDNTTVTLKVGDAEVTFKKERLDLERMKELNAAAAKESPAAAATSQPPALRGVVADEIKHWEGSRARAQALLDSCESGRQRCTEGDIKLAKAQLEDSERTLRFLREQDRILGEDPDTQRLENEHSELLSSRDVARHALDEAIRRQAPQSEVDYRRAQLDRAEKELDAKERELAARQR